MSEDDDNREYLINVGCVGGVTLARVWWLLEHPEIPATPEEVFALLAHDISDRRGLKYEWRHIDCDVMMELREKWLVILRRVRSCP